MKVSFTNQELTNIVSIAASNINVGDSIDMQADAVTQSIAFVLDKREQELDRIINSIGNGMNWLEDGSVETLDHLLGQSGRTAVVLIKYKKEKCGVVITKCGDKISEKDLIANVPVSGEYLTGKIWGMNFNQIKTVLRAVVGSRYIYNNFVIIGGDAKEKLREIGNAFKTDENERTADH
jgi:hypothetical protein